MPSGFLDQTVTSGLTRHQPLSKSNSSLWSELRHLISSHRRLSIAAGVLLLIIVIGSAARQGDRDRRDDQPTPGPETELPASVPDLVDSPVSESGGSALEFDGENDYVLVDSLRLDDIPLDQPLTIEFRVRWERGDPGNMVSWLGEYWIAVFTIRDDGVRDGETTIRVSVPTVCGRQFR